MTAFDIPSKRSLRSVATSERASAIVHYATIVLGFAGLIIIGRGQWFYFDEWDIIWQPEAARRFVEGHNGHWSAVPIAIWWAVQRTLGMGSYLPYLAIAIVAHLVVAHLLWRILRRVGSSMWISTSVVTVFIFLGAATENLMWAFQLGYMGAIAFGLGAVLIAMQRHLGPLGIVGITALLVLGSATSGTVLPFFATVAMIVLVRWGWLRALVCVGPPAVIYLVWFAFVAGPNPAAVFRATGIGNTLKGIPAFVATMFIGGYDAATPVPGFGLIVVLAIAGWTIWSLHSRARSYSMIAVSSLILAGTLFALLAAYSRLAMGVASAAEPRYIYVVIVTTLPCVALVLSSLVRAAAVRQIVVVALIAVVLAYNMGSLLTSARDESLIKVRTHKLISASLDLADAHPGAIDPTSRPDPVYLPRTLEQLQSLEANFGMPRIAYSEVDRLSALTNVSLTALSSAASSAGVCDQPLSVGEELTIDGSGIRVRAVDGAALTLAAVNGSARGNPKTLSLKPGGSVLTIVESTTFVVDSATAPVDLCPR